MVVHDEPEREQDAALEDARCDRGIADGAQQDRVVAAQLLDDGVGKQLPGLVVAAGAEVVLGRLHVEISGRRDRGEDLDGLRDDLGADAVTGDEGQIQGS